MATIDISKEVAELQAMYAKSLSDRYIRMLQFGDYKSGKTTALLKAPRPILIDSWDPGGTKVLRQGIKEGWIVADIRWEEENPFEPKQFAAFQSIHKQRKAAGFYDYFATYCLSSVTMFSMAAMSAVLKSLHRIDMVPKTDKTGNDYVAQVARIEPLLRDILNLPCHVILEAHPDTNEDNLGKAFVGPMVTGRLRQSIPIMLDEIYYLKTTETKDGVVRKWLTQPDGTYRCGSRLASNGKIQVWEDLDIRSIIQRGGYDSNDKPIPWLEGA